MVPARILKGKATIIAAFDARSRKLLHGLNEAILYVIEHVDELHTLGVIGRCKLDPKHFKSLDDFPIDIIDVLNNSEKIYRKGQCLMTCSPYRITANRVVLQYELGFPLEKSPSGVHLIDKCKYNHTKCRVADSCDDGIYKYLLDFAGIVDDVRSMVSMYSSNPVTSISTLTDSMLMRNFLCTSTIAYKHSNRGPSKDKREKGTQCTNTPTVNRSTQTRNFVKWSEPIHQERPRTYTDADVQSILDENDALRKENARLRLIISNQNDHNVEWHYPALK